MEFGLAWNTGPSPTVELWSGSSASVSWLSRVLLPCYELSQWTPRSEARLGDPHLRAHCFAEPLARRDLPYGATTVGGAWGDVVLGCLGALAPGSSIEWEIRAGGNDATLPTGGAAPGLEETLQPPGYRLKPLTTSERDLRDAMESRRRTPNWLVRGSVTGRGDRAQALAELVSSASRFEGGNAIRFVPRRPLLRGRASPFLLSEPELAALLPTPASPLASSPSEVTGGSTGFSIGHSAGDAPVFLPVEANQGRHLAILGETGMGKSSLLVRVALSASRQHTVLLLDPVGDTALSFLEALAPEHLGRVLFVSPRRSPVPLNALAALRVEGANGQPSERALHELVNALRRVRESRFAQTPFWGPRIEETVSRALGAAASWPNGTLTDALRLLERRGEPLRGVPPEARAAVAALQEAVAERPEEVEGARRLLSEVARSPTLRSLLAEPRALVRGEELVAPGRILVVSGDAPWVGESPSRYLLAVYLALLWSALLSRGRPTKTFLLLDEVQGYAHDSLAQMLRLGRRSNLHLVLATQSLRSLSEGVREATMTNAADFAVFRGSPDDAREISRWTTSVSPETLLSMPRGHATVLIGKGAWVASLRTRPLPMNPRPKDRLAEIRRGSARFFPPPGPDPLPGADRRPEKRRGPRGDLASRRQVLLALWAGSLSSPETPTFRVPLEGLRSLLGSEGGDLRELGAELGRAGALSAGGRRGRD
ncbi:MAG: DUF87 domain-containing protein, partial [Thermoplasmata archaeon]|nr:DUF87 domain-containing protein [Thermoplasmata archaeon]